VWQEALPGIGADEAWRGRTETRRERTEALVAADRRRRLDQRALRTELAQRRLAAKRHRQAERLAALDRQTQTEELTSAPACRGGAGAQP